MWEEKEHAEHCTASSVGPYFDSPNMVEIYFASKVHKYKFPFF